MVGIDLKVEVSTGSEAACFGELNAGTGGAGEFQFVTGEIDSIGSDIRQFGPKDLIGRRGDFVQNDQGRGRSLWEIYSVGSASRFVAVGPVFREIAPGIWLALG